jgi:hypothetical protein
MIRESSKFRLRWDIYIICMALYNSISIPLSIAFQVDALDSIGITIFEAFVDLSFFIDVLLNFRTTYISSVFDPVKIGRNYILYG